MSSESLHSSIPTQFCSWTLLPRQNHDTIPFMPISPLQSLIPLRKNDIKHHTPHAQSPFPTNPRHLEYHIIHLWDINARKQCQRSTHHRNEQWFILQQVHGEYRTTRMFHFKGVEEDEESEGCEDRGSGSVDGIAACVHAVVTIDSEISVSDDVDDDDEAEEWCGTHDDSINENIGSEFFVENSRDDIMRRTMHHIMSRRLQSQPKCQ